MPRLPRWTDIISFDVIIFAWLFTCFPCLFFVPWYFFTQDSLESPCTCGVFFCFLSSKVYAFQRRLAFFLKTAGSFQFSSSIFESLVACGRTQTCMLKVGKTFLNLLGVNLNIKIGPTVNGRNLANQLISVNMPLFTRFFAPSQVVVWDFFHQQYLQTCGQFYFYRNGMHMWIVSTSMHRHWLKSKR